MTAGKTARNSGAWLGDLSDISPVATTGEVIKNDPSGPWLFGVAATLTLSALIVAGHHLDQRHAVAIKRDAYLAGQANGVCRMWVQALRSDPTLAIGADGKALNTKCATVLNGTLG